MIALGVRGLPRGEYGRFLFATPPFGVGGSARLPLGESDDLPPGGGRLPLGGVYWSPPWGKDSHCGCNILPHGGKDSHWTWDEGMSKPMEGNVWMDECMD